MEDKTHADVPIWIGKRTVPGQPDVFYGRAVVPVVPLRAFEIMEDKARRLEWDPTWLPGDYKELHRRVEGTAVYDIYYESHAPMLGGFISAREILNVRVVRRQGDGTMTQVREALFHRLDMERGWAGPGRAGPRQRC